MPSSLAEAEFDDESVADDDLTAITESRVELAAGQGIGHEDAARLLLNG